MHYNYSYKVDDSNQQQHTNPESLLSTKKYATRPDIPTIIGTVTPRQKGQHGPATTIGEPSEYSMRINMFPTRRAQQQKQLCISFGNPLSATSVSHRVDMANLFIVCNAKEKRAVVSCARLQRILSIRGLAKRHYVLLFSPPWYLCGGTIIGRAPICWNGIDAVARASLFFSSIRRRLWRYWCGFCNWYHCRGVTVNELKTNNQPWKRMHALLVISEVSTIALFDYYYCIRLFDSFLAGSAVNNTPYQYSYNRVCSAVGVQRPWFLFFLLQCVLGVRVWQRGTLARHTEWL